MADIFCGCGTVAYEAKRNGIDFLGYDINPVATLIAKAKSEKYQKARLEKYFQEIVASFNRRKPNKNFYKKANRRLLGGERFIKNDGLHSLSISPGDFFKVGDSFYINIRPDCDCVAREPNSADSLNLYLLKASKMSQNQESDAYSPKFGNFQETDGNVIVFNMYDSKTFKINFKELEIKTWGELKDKRLGRLLPPYLTRLQQRYGLYQQRHGLPRTPKEAVHEKVEAVAGAAEKQKNTQ